MFNFGIVHSEHEIPSKHTDTLIYRVPNYKNQIIRKEFEIGYIQLRRTKQTNYNTNRLMVGIDEKH